MPKVIVINELLTELPIYQVLDWTSFQKFTLDLMQIRFKALESREFGSQGTEQLGIDVYSFHRDHLKMTVAQCKLKGDLKPSEIKAIAKKFLSSSLVTEANEFILATSAKLSRPVQIEALNQIRQDFFQRNITFFIWDSDGISSIFREESDIEYVNLVQRYFGNDVATTFYGRAFLTSFKKLGIIAKKKYSSPEYYLERQIVTYLEKDKVRESILFAGTKQTLISLLTSPDIKVNKKFIVLGTAGSGKSLEIENLAGKFSTDTSSLLPFKFKLADYEGESIEMMLTNIDEQWKDAISANLLILLDGLDEIKNEKYGAFINYMNAFIYQFPQANVVITSRYNFYEVDIQPLRNFEVYILRPITRQQIEEYLIYNLRSKNAKFKTLLKENGFEKYLLNLYFLNRLVKLYLHEKNNFPRNHSELFKKVLFEQLRQDEARHNVEALQHQLFPFAQKIAFCLTVLGRSTIKNEELIQIIPKSTTLKLLKHCGIVNKNVDEQNSWSFEHNNMREYLCASLLSTLPFEKVKNIISFDKDFQRIIPSFLNTTALLFEQLSETSQLYKDLFGWLEVNHREAFVRFEKEKISKPVRISIIKKILAYYKHEKLTIRVSDNFGYEELAAFAVFEKPMLEHFLIEISPDVNPDYVFDILMIIAQDQNAYLNKKTYFNIFDKILQGEYEAFLKARVIHIMFIHKRIERHTFEYVLRSDIDYNHGETLKALLYFLKETTYFEEYNDLIFDSISTLDKEALEKRIHGNYSPAKALILRFKKPESIFRILKSILKEPDFLNQHADRYKFHLEEEDFKSILVKALSLWQTDNSVLPLVYKIFTKHKDRTHDRRWVQLFFDFFTATCGMKTILYKFYKWDKYSRDLMEYADDEFCDFLIKEFKVEKIDANGLIIHRNRISWHNFDLAKRFQLKLNELDVQELHHKYDEVDYEAIRINRSVLNKKSLLDKNMLILEAKEIFKNTRKDIVSLSDIHNYENRKVRKFQDSVALKAIHETFADTNKNLIHFNDFLANYETKEQWDDFVVGYILNNILDKDVKVDLQYHTKILDWLNETIETADFFKETNFYSQKLYFLKQILKRYDVSLSDDQLLKILPADYESSTGIEKHGKENIANYVWKNISSIDELESRIFKNLDNDEINPEVACVHMLLAAKMQIPAVKPYIFNMITGEYNIHDLSKRALFESYKLIGGISSDFIDEINAPDETDNGNYASWKWYLIEALIETAGPSLDQLLQISLENESLLDNQVRAAKCFVMRGSEKGLIFLKDYILKYRLIPLENEWTELKPGILKMDPQNAVIILLEILEYYYTTDWNKVIFRSSVIWDIVQGNLISIAIGQPDKLDFIINGIVTIESKLVDKDTLHTARYGRERILQEFYKGHEAKFHYTLKQAIELHDENLKYFESYEA